MSMQKTMIPLICLGILLLGIVITPSVFAVGETAAGGCGEGTVLKGNECVLAESSGGSIPPLYIAGGAAAIGAAIIGIVFAVKRGSGGTSTPKPAKQDLDDYESQYLSRQRIRPSAKPAKKKEISMFCDNCGTAFKKSEAKFCGKCGTPRS